MSLPEVLLWQRLRGGRAGAKFRRQHPIGPYIIDFYCPDVKLAVEVDRDGHRSGERPAADERRDAFLRENGHRIAHFAAAAVLNDVGAVTTSIAALVESPLPQPAAGPPPRAGEEFR